jgi:hypothetical protein
MSFSPPMRVSVPSGVTIHVTLRLASSGCSRSESTAHLGRRSISSVTIGGPTQCADLLTGGPHVPTTWTTRWSSQTTTPSTSSFTALLGATTTLGTQEWLFPGSSGTASGSGSFVGNDAGQSTAFRFATGETPAEILAACGSSHGLAALRIVSGEAFFG